MVTMDDALALVPPKLPKDPEPKTEQDSISDTRLRLMPLEDLIEYTMVPKEEDRPFITWTFEGIVEHYGRKARGDDDLDVISKAALQQIEIENRMSSDAVAQASTGIEMLKHIAKWGIKRVVKWLVKQLWRGVFRIAKWIIKKVVTNAVRGVLDWVVRPLLMTALDFVGLNPELWPFVAAIGGVATLGYFLYDKFFAKGSGVPDPQAVADQAEKEDVDTTRTLADEGMRVVRPEPTSTAAVRPTGVSRAAPRAAAPQPAGAPVEAFAPNADDTNIMAMIQRHEGVKYKPYQDSVGKWTIGVGHLIGDGKSLPPEWDREFSAAEVQNLFAADYKKHKDAAKKIPNFDKLSISAQAALIDITYNMGPTWWHKWPAFTQYMQALDIKDAVTSLEDSKWYTQVGKRAVEDASLLAVGLASPSQNASVASQNVTTKPGVSTAAAAQPATNGTPTTQAQAPAAQPGASVASNSNRTIIQGQKGALIAVNS